MVCRCLGKSFGMITAGPTMCFRTVEISTRLRRLFPCVVLRVRFLPGFRRLLITSRITVRGAACGMSVGGALCTARGDGMVKPGRLKVGNALQRFSMDPSCDSIMLTLVLWFAMVLKATASCARCLGVQIARTTLLPTHRTGTRIVDGALGSIVCSRRQQMSHGA